MLNTLQIISKIYEDIASDYLQGKTPDCEEATAIKILAMGLNDSDGNIILSSLCEDLELVSRQDYNECSRGYSGDYLQPDEPAYDVTYTTVIFSSIDKRIKVNACVVYDNDENCSLEGDDSTYITVSIDGKPIFSDSYLNNAMQDAIYDNL